MLNKYTKINDDAKAFILEEINNIFHNKINDHILLERCHKEIDLLYSKGLLFIIEYLYKFKKKNRKVKYHFRGMANNLLLLYVLNLTPVDPVKYNLPLELFNDKTINVDLINSSPKNFVSYIEKNVFSFKIVACSYEKDIDEEINGFEENHYMIIPEICIPTNMLFRINDFGMYETVEDYKKYKDEFIIIKVDVKAPIKHSEKICLQNVVNNEFEELLSDELKPKAIQDYIKIKCLSHGTDVWKNNQDILFKNGKLDIKSLLASREDIYEYLIDKGIDNSNAKDIISYKCKYHLKEDEKIWNKYVDIMKESNCDIMFIEIISKILYIFGRGQAASECLYALDKDNYCDV